MEFHFVCGFVHYSDCDEYYSEELDQIPVRITQRVSNKSVTGFLIPAHAPQPLRPSSSPLETGESIVEEDLN